MLHVPGGQFLHGEVSSATASAGVTVTWRDANGGIVTPVGRLIIYDIQITAVAAGRVSLIQGASDAAGAVIVGGTFPVNSTIITRFERPFECVFSNNLKVFAPAGQVDAIVNAELVEV
jgi:hypothetical protein